ncbi:MAG: sigma-70 family RNA polymerase sigma factor [Acidimicrobiia bacterium]|jgi:RNA polymerase sigma-B factor
MPKEAALTLDATPRSAAAARAFLREHATLDSMRHSEADLLVTELIGNVLQHSPAASEVTVSVTQDNERELTISVSHEHVDPVDLGPPGVGHLLLDRVSRSWGHEHEDGTLTFWFVVRTPGTTAISDDVSDDTLFRRMADDPAAYSDELVRRHGDLAASIARRYRGKGLDDDDLRQVANMALLKAIQRYDPSLGDIRPYAAATISGELKRLLRDRGWSVRVPRALQERSLEVARASEELAQDLKRPPDTSELAERTNLTEGEVAEAMDARLAYMSNSIDRPDEGTGLSIADVLRAEDSQLLVADDRLVIADAIRGLPEREQRILHLRFVEDLTQSEIASEVGISQMHVSRLLARALETLKETIAETA